MTMHSPINQPSGEPLPGRPVKEARPTQPSLRFRVTLIGVASFLLWMAILVSIRLALA